MRVAKAKGLPVELLRFSDEEDFLEKLNSVTKPNRNVEIVRLRHNLAHGNIFDYIERPQELDEQLFVPDLLENVTIEVSRISHSWLAGVCEFRAVNLAAWSKE